MRGLANKLFMLTILFGLIVPLLAAQVEPDELEAWKHTASVVRMLTQYEGPASDYAPVTQQRLDEIVSALRNDEVDRAEELFSTFLGEYKLTGATPDARNEELRELFNSVMREAYSRDVADLRYVADKVRYYNDAIAIANKYIVELEKYRAEAGDGEVTITTTELKRSYAYAESPETMGSVRRLSGSGINAEIERVKRQITDMEKQTENAVEQMQFAARRRLRIVNNIVAVYDRFHAVLENHLESVEEREEQP